MATALPRHVVLNIPKAGKNTSYVYRENDESVVAGNNDMFSELVKIEMERSKIGNILVHLRFSHTNRYWQKKEDGDSIVAVSNKPEEDTTKASCTLFQPIRQLDNVVYLTHIHTGWRVMMNNSTRGLYVDKNSVGAPLGFIDWDTLVKLPKHVAFKGNNGEYLKVLTDKDYLQFGSDDPNDEKSGHEVSLMRDGHVRIKSDYRGLFWRRDPNWIKADSDDVTANNKETLFWPIKIDDNTIALRSAGNDKFCKRLTLDGKENCLNAAVQNLTREARFKVEELVSAREIYNVVYRMEDARIYGETPYLAGSATVTNRSDEAGSVEVALKYSDTKIYSFARSVSVTAGVTHTITAGIPGIGEAGMTVSAQISSTLEWKNSTKETFEATAKDTIPVPARSIAVVNYVGTKATCDVPFSYTQQDRSSTTGQITETDQIDGVFTGVNSYGFKFTIEKYQPLAE